VPLKDAPATWAKTGDELRTVIKKIVNNEQTTKPSFSTTLLLDIIVPPMARIR
jgi:hypothetical protein